MKSKIFQIYYSEETKNIIDPSFIPLDNMKNERPDWREYWPIRNYLINNEIEDGVMYGFFSPKFFKKTEIEGDKVIDFINSMDEKDADVVNFSPYYAQAVFFQNVLEQAYSVHKSGFSNILSSVEFLFPGLQVSSLINTSVDTIYCNYFVANKKFWSEWLELCEKIYLAAESNSSSMHNVLNENIHYEVDGLPFKIFLIERIASLILLQNKKFNVVKFNRADNDKCCYFGTKFNPDEHHDDLMRIDAYKIAYLETKNDKYMSMFSDLRQSVIAKVL